METDCQKAVEYGLERLSNFAQVNKDKPVQEKVESLELVAEAAGLESADFEYIVELAAKRFRLYSGFVTTGILIGLFMSQYLEEEAKK